MQQASTYLAQNDVINLIPGNSELVGELSKISVSSLIGGIIILLLIVASLVFFFMLLLGGIKYITSGGDKAQTETARSQITSALIGLVIVFSAWAIVSLIQIFFSVNIMSIDIPSISNL